MLTAASSAAVLPCQGYGGGWLQGILLNMTAAAEAAGYLMAFPESATAVLIVTASLPLSATAAVLLLAAVADTALLCAQGHTVWAGRSAGVERGTVVSSWRTLSCPRCHRRSPAPHIPAVCAALFSCASNASTTGDDVQFTKEAVALVQKTVSVDPQRRYALGWSNGGFFTEMLACQTADLWAGVSSNAGAVVIAPGGHGGQQSCDLSFGTSRLNYLHLHGTADYVVNWSGAVFTGDGSLIPSALGDLARWVNRLGCRPSRVLQTVNDLVSFSNIVWQECRDGREVELMTVKNGGHDWWTQRRHGFDTTAYILSFFTRTYYKQRQPVDMM